MTRIWTGTADVVSGYTTVVLTGDPLTAANCPSDATIVLAGATYFVAEADYPTMTVELTRAYEAGDGTVSAEIDPMTPLTGSVVALAKSIADYDAQLALLEARGLGLFYETLGQTGANDPEPGNIARNASTWAASTALYLDVLDASEAHHDQSARIDQLATGDSLVVESLSTGAYAAFTVNGSITAPSGWRTVPVAYVGGAGMLADGESVRVISLKRGPAGADGVDGTNGTDGADGADGTGVPAGGSTGQALVKISGTDLDTGWAARREVLTANRTYYVRTDGSDSNNGLANTSGGAFLTIQKAINTIVGNLDLAGFTVTIQVGDGTYTGAASFSAPWTGGGAVTIQGNSSTPANVLVSVTGNAMANSGVLPGTLTVKDMKLASSGGALLLNTGVGLINFSNIDFGSSARRADCRKWPRCAHRLHG